MTDPHNQSPPDPHPGSTSGSGAGSGLGVRWYVGLVHGAEADRLGRQQATILLRISRWWMNRADTTRAGTARPEPESAPQGPAR